MQADPIIISNLLYYSFCFSIWRMLFCSRIRSFLNLLQISKLGTRRSPCSKIFGSDLGKIFPNRWGILLHPDISKYENMFWLFYLRQDDGERMWRRRVEDLTNKNQNLNDQVKMQVNKVCTYRYWVVDINTSLDNRIFLVCEKQVSVTCIKV